MVDSVASPEEAADTVTSEGAKIETEALAKINAALQAELKAVVAADAAAAAAAESHGSHGAEVDDLREKLRTALGRAASSSTAARKASTEQSAAGAGAPLPGSGAFQAVDSHLDATVSASTEAYDLQQKLRALEG